MAPCTLRISAEQWRRLEAHLFPGDDDEHGAVIVAGLAETPRGIRLLAREVVFARDGIDYVPGEHGYRMLTPTFVRENIMRCRDEKLAYLAVHCHGGFDRVGFSSDDMTSHERGYPALRAIARGQIVGAVVFAKNSAAGDLWLSNGGRAELAEVTIVGRPMRRLYPTPPLNPVQDPSYDRQARIFGDRGQALLRAEKVGVIGAGGVGSLLVEYLSRLGVGHMVVIDPQRIETSNLPRVVDGTRWDAHAWLTSADRPFWLQRIGRRFATPKVRIANRVARRAHPTMRIDAISGDVVDESVVERLIDCDYLFLAADSMQSRLIFNALVHQYLIPGVQAGAKVTVDPSTGLITNVFSVMRPLTPDFGCLWCNELISPAGLQDEALTADQRRKQRYVDEPEVVAPSVITLNAVAAAHAADDYLFCTTGLLGGDSEYHCQWPSQSPRFWPTESPHPLGLLSPSS
jgi:molybdopterin/thiamine biosynthesis adenylyltransferase